jgi:hypothetical protein
LKIASKTGAAQDDVLERVMDAVVAWMQTVQGTRT